MSTTNTIEKPKQEDPAPQRPPETLPEPRPADPKMSRKNGNLSPQK